MSTHPDLTLDQIRDLTPSELAAIVGRLEGEDTSDARIAYLAELFAGDKEARPYDIAVLTAQAQAMSGHPLVFVTHPDLAPTWRVSWCVESVLHGEGGSMVLEDYPSAGQRDTLAAALAETIAMLDRWEYRSACTREGLPTDSDCFKLVHHDWVTDGKNLVRRDAVERFGGHLGPFKRPNPDMAAELLASFLTARRTSAKVTYGRAAATVRSARVGEASVPLHIAQALAGCDWELSYGAGREGHHYAIATVDGAAIAVISPLEAS